ncbi:integral membrane protein GPR155 [Pygocentrus nattereri]|uniref:integral membrane protein GPR155 n=1 Tax=Pygocentrus nattereri TaxID=42514 RepID=UPI000814639A|nr:integral membrane protein GPR155 [Pygocentrus nattereri]XP_037392421.1 integral membrane protein GPR155 [Pygocentrus nattereri]
MEGHYVTIHGLNVTHNALSTPAMSIDRLFPALLECFGIILCGYVAGRIGVIGAGQVKGLGSFVSCFALPALLFKNMVQLQFADVVWSFLWSVLIAKVCVFVLVCTLTLLVADPESKYSKAGLFSIFATQSNDFALGYPIVDALYRSSHPDYGQYLYLVAPVSLMLLNPVGFALCELQCWRQSPDHNHSKLHIIATVLLRVIKNPIVFMVMVGIICHFLFGGHVPALLGEFVDGLADSFGGAALFYLGLTMVGQMHKLNRSTGVTLILLITAKLLMMPLMCKDMLELLDAGNSGNRSANHSSLSDYAFLYGVFPTAPSVAIYAGQYNMQLEVVTSGMVISTLLSAPIMYLSAWLLTIPWMEARHLISELQEVSFNISIISLIALVWTIAVMLLSKKFKRLPHMFATNLFLAQLLVCVSMVLWKFVVHQDNMLAQILTFTLLYGSLYSTYLWTGLLAFALTLLKKNEKLKVRPIIFILLGWGVPFLIVGLLLVVGERESKTTDSAFFYGKWQIVSSLGVLSCGILLGGVSLMGLSQSTQEEQSYQALEQSSMSGTTEDLRDPPQPENQNSSERATSHGSLNRDHSDPMPDMISDRLNDSPAPPSGAALCETSSCVRTQEERQVARHVLLCLLLIVSLLANLSSCLWWLLNTDPGRLYLELQFFCAVTNYGQGFISFGIFGLDEHLIILPFKKRLAAFCGGSQEESCGPAAVPEEIRLTCTQFVRYHKNQCVQDIVRKSGSTESLSGPVGESLL